MEESPATNRGTDVVDKVRMFKEPMHVAVITEDINAMKSLKKSGVKINDVENGQTPLHLAVMLRKTLAVKKLISLGANKSKTNKDGYTPLHLAVINDSVSLIGDLIDMNTESDVDTFDENGFTPLHIAVVLGKVDAIQKLLDEGADADLPNKEGTAPLHFALVQGYSDVIDILVQYVAKPNILNRREFRPLHLAVMYNRIDAIGKVGSIEGVNVNYLNGDGDSALHIATKLGNLAAIEKLYDLEANMNLRNSKGYCPIHLAVMFNRLSAIERLVQCGAHLDSGDRLRNTAVHLAVAQNNLLALTFLGRLGANVNIKNGNGDSPLQCAAMDGNSRAMRILLQCGATINVLNAKGMTPLHTAVCLGNVDVIENLFRYGASVHSLDAAGNRPLHSAAKLCNSVGIKTLIKFGARLSSMNRDGLTALDIIMQYVRENTFKSSLKTLNDLYKKRNLKRKSVLDAHEILKSAKAIFKFEILKNLEHTKLSDPEYVSNIIPILRSYLNECVAEVKLMKSFLLHESFPFYSFVMFGWNYSMPLTFNYTSEVALNHLLDVSTTKGYPVYRKDIVSKLERPALLKKVLCLRMLARQDGKTIFIDEDAIPLIINHLENDDILNLLLAYSDLDTNTGVSESPNVGKRKFASSGCSSVNKKSNKIQGTKKTRLQKCVKKSRSLSANSSEIISSSMITRSKKASNSKTGGGGKKVVKTQKSVVKTNNANQISVDKKSSKTKRASPRIKTIKRNNRTLAKKITRKKCSSSVIKSIKENCPALSTRSKKEKSCSVNSKMSRRITKSSNSKNKN